MSPPIFKVSFDADISLFTLYIAGAMKQYYFLSACNLLLTSNFLFAHLNPMQLCVSQHMQMKQQ